MKRAGGMEGEGGLRDEEQGAVMQCAQDTASVATASVIQGVVCTSVICGALCGASCVVYTPLQRHSVCTHAQQNRLLSTFVLGPDGQCGA